MKNYRKAISRKTEELISDGWINDKITSADTKTWKYCSFDQLVACHHDVSSSWTNHFGDDFIKTKLFFTNIEPTIFLGYQQLGVNAKLLKWFDDDLNLTNNVLEARYFITDQTPFYASRGGQNHDTGIAVINTANKSFQLQITAVIYQQNIILHRFSDDWKKQLKDHLPDLDTLNSSSNNVVLLVDKHHRENLARNHSATHLLHQVVKRLYGQDVVQKGSAIYSAYFRFDFNSSVTVNEIKGSEINRMVNAQICAQLQGVTKIRTLKSIQNDDLIEKHFQENYPANVRTIRFGNFSYEVCSGTHVENTCQIEAFLITKITSIGNQRFRVHAITSWATIYQFYLTKIAKYNELYDQLGDHTFVDATKLIKGRPTPLSIDKFKKQWRTLIKNSFFLMIDLLIKKITVQISNLQNKKHKISATIANQDVIVQMSTEKYVWPPNKYLYCWENQKTEREGKRNIVNLLKDLKNQKSLFNRNSILLFVQQQAAKKSSQITVYTQIFNENNPGNLVNAADILKKITTQFGNGKGGGSTSLAQGVILKMNISIYDIVNYLQVEKPQA